MNKCLLVLAVFTFFSCSSSDKADENSELGMAFSYEMDTVLVDSGDHFFFLNWDLSLSDISKDQKLLYNLNPQTYLLEIVDLDELKLKKTVQLEKEGPNGVGAPYYSKIQVLENGNIGLFGQFKINIISDQGKLVKTIELDQIKIQNIAQNEEEKIGWESVFSDDGKLYASTLVNVDYKKPASGVVIVDLETDSTKYISMNLFERLKQFEVLFQEGNMPGISSTELTYLSFVEYNLIISSSAFNEVYKYDTRTDSLSHYSFNAKLTDNEKTQNFPNVVSSDKEWNAAEKAKSEQVSFKEFFKIPEQNIYWRISTDLDRNIGDSLVIKHVVTFFDTDFKMLKEQELENFHSSNKPFFKDGMLYNFINIDDELAFVHLKPTISHE